MWDIFARSARTEGLVIFPEAWYKILICALISASVVVHNAVFWTNMNNIRRIVLISGTLDIRAAVASVSSMIASGTLVLYLVHGTILPHIHHSRLICPQHI